MNKTLDPRVVRTRRLLINALTELIVTGGYEPITIREIVQKAEVNRSTFYLHFRDKQDILTQMQDDLLNELSKSLEYSLYTYELAINDYINLNKPIKSHVSMFEHIQKYSSLYQKILSEKEFRERFTQGIKTEVLRFRDSVLEATFMANGAVGVILYWLDNGMKETITEMSLWLTQITLFPLGKFK
ncbi:transcriptional regulator, TetR family [Psychrobacillus sp. OK028]|uniref:TetR/AcrR family transcriptional regulator n=1 Tax=Psychrobacillus sp. OK028 TaxID=1884359 RepID=UPI00088B748D|nr:TetR/AcrR family transcriptional regulator [Psychrobacillus sp. OK028]SDN12566.1 transcriptional regulator, TetR family [Psychrobacillus sp. OK028]